MPPKLQDRAALINRIYLSLTGGNIARIARRVKRGVLRVYFSLGASFAYQSQTLADAPV